MSDLAESATRSWKVGAFTCCLTIPRSGRGRLMSAVVEWSPCQPSRLTDAEMKQYRLGRNLALAEIAAELQIATAVVEL